MELYLIKAAWIYLIIINVITLLVWGADKHKAKRNKWRVPERQLWLLAALGGGPAAFLGMQLFHHKTKKLRFQIGIPALAASQLVLLVMVLWK